LSKLEQVLALDEAISIAELNSTNAELYASRVKSLNINIVNRKITDPTGFYVLLGKYMNKSEGDVRADIIDYATNTQDTETIVSIVKLAGKLFHCL